MIALSMLLAAVVIPQTDGDFEEEARNDPPDPTPPQIAPIEEVFRGSFGDDAIDGTPEDDVIFSYSGDDMIRGDSGNDTIYPGEGDDIVNGGRGNDRILGSPGRDLLDGSLGNDRIYGGADDDVINGNYGADNLRGGDGNDTIYGGFNVRQQDDGLIAARQTGDVIRGDNGDDRIFVWGGDSRADGSADDDVLVAVTGVAELTGGQGADGFYLLANASDDQLTEVTITDFDPLHDRLTLTLDQLEDTGNLPELDVTLTETTVEGVSGVRVDAVFSGPENGTPQSESAAAFLQGVTVADLGPANITAVVTTAADIFDGEATLRTL